ncbi:hypothetical protein CHU93_10215 [Sandarakinorhabdus cyanobacteriorum]|uniref:Uncharacterized protein n=1 Tax=Sandarakinorhabdus cyanobacteriorum TaxID=1981098 RepID=A0A255YEK3_9SPHN|nr:hypothetical protein [Sandarakinorhabdus cyanobacteriorum]OYQ27631.1 hypothetical protein CHU93_10215 [Sandarakinorhabdus cyanobacteriorum]
MYIANDVPSRHAGCHEVRSVWIDLPPGDERDKLWLMFEILGWQVSGPAAAGGHDKPAQDCRLQLCSRGRVVAVATTDHQLAAVLARQGLDRLIMPVALPALEQLMVVAG